MATRYLSLLFRNRSQTQTLLKNSFWLGIADGATRLTKFLLTLYVIRTFGRLEYGKFAFAFAFVALFSTFFDTPTGGNGSAVARRWIPAMDLVETDDHYVLTADLPGLTEGDINLEFEGDVLTLSGERTSEHSERKEGFYRLERSTGTFSRSLTLPEGIDPEAVTATFDKGVLEVRIPKPEQRKPRKAAATTGAGEVPTIKPRLGRHRSIPPA